MKRYLILLLILIITISSTTAGQLAYNDNDNYIQSLTVFEDEIIYGKSDGTTTIQGSDGAERTFRGFGGHNNILSVERFADILVMVSEYNYTEFYNTTSGNLIQREMFDFPLTDVVYSESMDRLLISDIAGHFYLYNTTDLSLIETIGFSNLIYNPDVPKENCVNCGIIDMKEKNGIITLIWGWNVYQIDLNDRLVISRIDTSGGTPVSVVIGDDKTVVHYLEDEFIDVYQNGITTSIKTKFIVESMTILNGDIVISSDNTIGIYNEKWSYYITEGNVEILSTIDNRLVIASTFGITISNIEDLQNKPLVDPVFLTYLVWIVFISILFASLLVLRMPIRMKMRLLSQYIRLRRLGFRSKEEYENAKSKGFSDRRMYDLITSEGFENFDAYLESISSPSRDLPPIDEKQLVIEKKNLNFSPKVLIIILIEISLVIINIDVFLLINSVILINLIVYSIYSRLSRSTTFARILVIGFTLMIIIASLTSNPPGELVTKVDGKILSINEYQGGLLIQSDQGIFLYRDDGLEVILEVANTTAGKMYSGEFYYVKGDTVNDLNGGKWVFPSVTGILDFLVTEDKIYLSSVDHNLYILDNYGNISSLNNLPINPTEYCINCDIVDLEIIDGMIFALSDASIVYKINSVNNGMIDYFSVHNTGETVNSMEISNDLLLLTYTGGDIRIYKNGNIYSWFDGSSDISIARFLDESTIISANFEGEIEFLLIEYGNIRSFETIQYYLPERIVTGLSPEGLFLGMFSGEVFDINSDRFILYDASYIWLEFILIVILGIHRINRGLKEIKS